MSDNVIEFPGVIQTSLDDGVSELPLEEVLNGAKESDLSSVIVIGIDPDGNLYIATQSNNIAKVLFFLEKAKIVLLSDG